MPRGKKRTIERQEPSAEVRQYYARKVGTAISSVTDMVLGAGRHNGAYTPADIETFVQVRDMLYPIYNRLGGGQ